MQFLFVEFTALFGKIFEYARFQHSLFACRFEVLFRLHYHSLQHGIKLFKTARQKIGYTLLRWLWK